jgi:hypothetical protein
VAARVICISRSVGAHGEQVGRLVSAQLGFRYLDEELISDTAQREQVDAALLADVERRKSFLERVLGALAVAGSEAYMAPLSPELTGENERYRELIREAIEESAAQGNVVIVAHAASYALAGKEGLLRIFVTASPDVRARRLAEEQGLEESEARNRISDSDTNRADYIERFYDVDRELPVHYDVVVNTDELTPEQAAAVVLEAAKA